MQKYGVEFKDGRVVEVEARDGDQAKQKAYDIAARENPTEPKGHPSRAVARVIHPED